MIKKILFNSLVAHGKNTGEEFPRKFSNTESSLQSSLGFYVTESTYNGSNGFSLKLHGMDKGFNDRAFTACYSDAWSRLRDAKILYKISA